MPPGIILSDNGTTIAVAEGYEGQYETIGAVEVKYVFHNYALQNLYFTTGDYQETWRKAVCWPQAPLKMLTLGAWNILPFSWPCWVSGDDTDERGRTKVMSRALAQGVKAMGGNLLLITGHGQTVITTVNASTGAQIGQSVTPATGMSGFAIKVLKPHPDEEPDNQL